jgi:hypothetical protein
MSTGFWTDFHTEPKRNFRFLMLLGGIPSWIVKKTGKPNFTIKDATHKYLNHTFHYPGGVEWEKITVELVDPVAPDASKTIQDIINASGYHFPQDPNDVSTISKRGAVSALGQVTIQQIGAEEGEIVEEWILHNAFVSKVSYGELSYEDEGLTTISLEITYDYAEMTRSGEGVAPANK